MSKVYLGFDIKFHNCNIKNQKELDQFTSRLRVYLEQFHINNLQSSSDLEIELVESAGEFE